MAGASASGYRFGSQTVAGQGNADANGAEANDVSVQFYNPAGLTRLKGKQLQLGGTIVAPRFSFEDSGSTRFTGSATGGDTSPANIAPDAAFAPNGYFSMPLTRDLTFGVGVFVPYGAKLDYGDTWSGRYALNAIEMKSLNINPSIAWKASEHHSFGAGISAEYMKAKLSQSVDVPGSIAALPSATAIALATQIATAGGNPSLLGAAKDGQAKMNGEDWGFGFNLGYLFELDANTRFGLAYRSQIRHKLTGDATWDFSSVTSDPIVNRFVQAASGKANSDARVRLTTPETVSANAFHQINDTWAVMGDVTWTRNSRLKDLHIEFPGTSEGDEVIRQQWRDTVRVSVGANYRINQRYLVRAGYAYDQSPVRNAELTHPALPDGDRNWLSLGLNVKLDDKSSIDMAYSYVKLDDVRGNYTNACYPTSTTCTGNGETTKGLYQTYLQFFGLSYTYRF